MQNPTVGRIVHFRATQDANPEAALIVNVHDSTTITCVVWNTGGTARTETRVAQGDGAGEWNWPARV